MIHRMIKVVALVFLIAALETDFSARALKSGPCPTVKLDCNDFRDALPITCVAVLSSADSATRLTYTWRLSSGTITNGQGTPQVQISFDRERVTSMIVTVETVGLPPACPARASNGWLNCALQPSRKVYEYGEISLSDEKALLDKFASVLDTEETAQGFIVAYGGIKRPRVEALKRADRAKGYLLSKQVFYNPRLNTIDCGYRERPATELWLTPVGVAPPVCTPTVDPVELQKRKRPQMNADRR